MKPSEVLPALQETDEFVRLQDEAAAAAGRRQAALTERAKEHAGEVTVIP